MQSITPQTAFIPSKPGFASKRRWVSRTNLEWNQSGAGKNSSPARSAKTKTVVKQYMKTLTKLALVSAIGMGVCSILVLAQDANHSPPDGDRPPDDMGPPRGPR